jgi:hypothetical protein
MSDFHVLTQAADRKTVELIYHFPVPDTNNAAAISYQAALVQHLGGAEAITSPVADAAELAQLKAGEVLEHSTILRWSRLGLTSIQKLAEIKGDYNARKAEILGEMQTLLEFYGYAATAI